MESIESIALVMAALVMAGVEFSKRAGLPSRWAPIAALVWAATFAILGRLAGMSGLAEQSWPGVALTAIVSAFVAAGAYSGTKAVVQTDREDERRAA